MSRKSSHLMPVLVAASGVCGLATAPVNALELGDINVQSALGQPLRASIAYALNANEQLHGYCVSLRSGPQGSDSPVIQDARISINQAGIQISGDAAVREPLLNLQVVVNCAYTPHLVREYTLLVDPLAPLEPRPAMFADSSSPNTQSTAAAAESQLVTRPAVRQRIADESSIAMNSRYRVQTDDSVSTIVSRIDGRTVGMWPAINMILAANPDAFVDQDANRLTAGSELFIPDLTENAAAETTAAINNVETRAVASEPVMEVVVTNEEPLVVNTTSEFEVAVELPVAVSDEATETELVIEPVVEPAVVTEAIQVEDAPATVETVNELQPGDLVMPAAGTTDAVITSSNNSASVPIVSTATPTETGTSGSWTWLAILAGTGIAIIGGLFMFGRRIRERFSPAPTPAVHKPNIVSDVDFEFNDTISAEAISLDADLGAGTGLNAGAQIDVAEDFGFSANGQAESELDLEITESESSEPEENPTDIIAPNHREESPTILDAEEPPNDEDDYDMSMIVDATKQSLDQYDATAKDLQAVQLEATNSGVESSDYTMNSDGDFEALEQDYQEEFTATMAANAEIERVAMELANRMENDDALEVTREMPVENSDAGDVSDEDVTREMPLKEPAADVVSDEDLTVEMPPQQDSDVTAELAANILTAGEAENDSTVEEVEDLFEKTAAGSDISVDLNIQSGKVDTKKK